MSVDRPSGGPYRSATAVGAAAPASLPCPFCGNDCPALVRVCPHCDVRLDSVRCGRCYSLQAPGSFACARCGQALELEPVLDATDAPCPRCKSPLEAAARGAVDKHDRRTTDGRVHECARCGGMFVPKEALAEILAQAELGGPIPATPHRATSIEVVSYVPCPMCHATMNRINFGKLSGVIIDVCHKHGTWFDAGELTRVITFVASGGLARTKAREAIERSEGGGPDDDRKARLRATAAVLQETRDQHAEIERWTDLLASLFSW